MSVVIDEQVTQTALSGDTIQSLVDAVFDAHQVDKRHEVSLAFVSRATIYELNERYRNKAQETDVLSFELDNPFDTYDDFERALIGDIAICVDVAHERSVEFGTTLREELALLLVHGCLHLLGYDHEQEDEARTMEAVERRILAQEGFTSKGYEVL